MPLDREGILPPDEALPFDGFCPFKQLAEGARAKAPHLDIEPLGAAQIDVAAGHSRLVADKADSAVNRLCAAIAEAVDFLAEEMLKPEQAGCYKFDNHST